MALVGRRREMDEVGRLLALATDGQGGVLVITGPAESGRTELVAAAAREGARRGFEVLRTAAMRSQRGWMVWAQLLRDAGAPDELVSIVLGEPGPLDLDTVARELTAGSPRLLVIDDIDHAGDEALRVLRLVAARAAASSTAVIVASVLPLGLGTELPLGGLSAGELAAMVPEVPPEARHAVWLASRGLPGVAKSMATDLAASGDDLDPLVHLALTAPSQAEFLDVDTGLVRLLEMAIPRAPDDSARARLLARLAHELLGDSSAGPRRRILADEALKLARDGGEPGILAEVLDARLHALWDPAGAEDRLAAAAEILDLAQAAGDDIRERHGMFWRFVALMELGRVGEAESALAAFERAAIASGDSQAAVMATARHAMLATFRGRFDEAVRLIAQVAADGARAGLPDTERLVAALSGEVAFYQGPAAAPFTVDQLLALARRLPGHFMEANAAAWLMMLGQEDKAQAEMGRVLPTVLAGSGPRWLGAAAMLAFVAAIPALDLAAGGPGLAISDAEPLLDPASRETYRHRIRELESELSAADRTGDSIAAGRADKERRALVSELRRATGLAGRPRRAAAEAERARVNVTRTIRAAIDRIMLAAPIAGAHLQSSIRTGTACRYQPPAGGPARWRT